MNIVDNMDPINLGCHLKSMHQVKFAISRKMSPDRKVSRAENSNASLALDSDSEDEEEEEDEEGEGEVDEGGGGGEEEEGMSSDDEEGERCPICLLRLRLQPVGRPQPCQHLFCLVTIHNPFLILAIYHLRV